MIRTRSRRLGAALLVSGRLRGLALRVPGDEGLPPAVQRQGPDRLGHPGGQVAFHGRERRDRRPDGRGEAEEERVPGDRQGLRRLRAQGQGEDPQWQLGHPVPQQARRRTARSPAPRPTWPTTSGACCTRSGAGASSSATRSRRPRPCSSPTAGTSSSSPPRASHVTIDLNGTRIIDREDPMFDKEGVIALQIHVWPEPMEVRYKDIEIQEL